MAGLGDKMRDKLKSEGMRLGMKAVSKLMESPERADKVTKAMETVLQSKEKIDDTTHWLLNFSNLPSSDDVADLGRQAGRLRREAKKILARVDDLHDKLDEALQK